MAYHAENGIYRTNRGAIMGGVCAGLSEYLHIDVSIVRILFVCLMFAFGSALVLYLLLWIFLPLR